MTLNWYGDAINQKITAGAIRGLTKAASYVHSRTIPKTPIDTGALRNSLQITPASFGNPQSSIHSNLPYAVIQHERMDFAHPGGGQAKFLELAVRESSDAITTIINSEIQRG